MDVSVVELRFVQGCNFLCYIGSVIEIIMNIADATRPVITIKALHLRMLITKLHSNRIGRSHMCSQHFRTFIVIVVLILSLKM